MPLFVHLCLVRLLCCCEGALALFHLGLLQSMVGGLLQAFISLRLVSSSVSFDPGYLLRPIMVYFFWSSCLSSSLGATSLFKVSLVIFLGGLSCISRRWQFVISGCSSQVQEGYVRVSLGGFALRRAALNENTWLSNS